MTRPRRLLAATITAIAVGISTAAIAAPAVAGTTTDYGFGGRGYGTEVRGGATGVSSGRTAESLLGCTRMTGKKRHETAAAADASGALTAETIDSTTQSYKTKRTFGTKSTNRIAKVVIGEADGVNITIEGLKTTANASVLRKSGKFGTKSTYSSTEIDGNTGEPEIDGVLDDVDAGIGDLLDAIRENGPIELPGLALIQLGNKNNVVKKQRVTAQASALRVVLYGPDTLRGTDDDAIAIIGKSRATVKRGLTAGVFNGRAVPAQAQVLGELGRVGRVIQKPLPCEGTGGKARSTGLVDANPLLTDVLGLGAAKATTWGVQRDKGSAEGWTRSEIVGLDLGDGALKVKGIVGRALVKTNRDGKVTARSIKGSTIGSLVIDGNKQAIPDPGQTIEVPGVAKLQFFVKNRSQRGISVTALRVTLLDGTGAVVNLGSARTTIKRS